MADDIVAIRHFTASRTHNGKPYNIVKITTPYHEVEVTVSPTGRSVHLWLDGEYMEARRG